MPETPTKRKLDVDLESAASPRTAPRKKQSAAIREEESGGSEGSTADREAEVLKYLGRFRPRRKLQRELASASASASGEEALVVLLRGVASGTLNGNSEAVGGDGNSELRQFIIAYGAVRTFAGLRADRLDGLSPITSHLRSRWAALRSAGPALPSGQVVVREVDDLAEACILGGFHRNLSFASKALAMLGLEVPIYSSEGKAFLGLPAAVSYGAFFDAWTAAYAPRRAAYEAAATAHLAVDAGLEHELGVAWFAMRGFDVHLMAVGGPMRKK